MGNYGFIKCYSKAQQDYIRRNAIFLHTVIVYQICQACIKKRTALTKSKMMNLRDINSSELKKVVSNIHKVCSNRNTSANVVDKNMIHMYLKNIA